MRRPRLLTLVVLPALLVAAACGAEQTEEAAAGLDAVRVSGEVGQAPKVTWNSRVNTDELETEVLVEGEGAKLAAGDQVLTHLWIGNGFSQRTVFSTYDEGGNPQLLTVDDDQLLGALREAIAGQRVGARVLAVAPPEAAFGAQGNPDLDIGNTDDVVFVVDLTAKVLDEPSGRRVRPPRNAPAVVEKDGVVTGIDFARAPNRPPGRLQVLTLVRGNGPRVADGDTAVLDYLGQVYGSRKVFDQSFDKESFTTALGEGQVIQGWDRGLVGVPVGSRVLLTIPPDLAYGEQGSGQNIPPNATLTFVVDVLAAY